MNRICSRYILRSCSLLLVMATAGAGCATVIRGLDEDVSFSSVPPGASVTVDGKEIGVTPTSASLARHDSHSIRIEKAGYIPYEVKTTTAFSNWEWADFPLGILFPPLVLIMFFDRGADEIEPHDISANLIAVSTSANASSVPAPLPSATTSLPAVPSPAAKPSAAAVPSPTSGPSSAPDGSPAAGASPDASD